MVDNLHVTLGRLFQESVEAMAAELKKARARAERAEAEAAVMREALEQAIGAINNALVLLEQMQGWHADTAAGLLRNAPRSVPSDAGRALLERVRKLVEKATAVIESDIPEDITCSSPAGHIKLATLIDRISQLAAAVRALEADDGR